MSPRLWLPPPGSSSSGATMCPRGSGSRLLAQGSPGATTCLEDRLYRLQVIKQISPDDLAVMISIGARAHVSSKAVRDKGCSALSQGMQQVAH
jgi:hypothetical protein